MVHFIGAGPGAPDLITVRGQKLLCEADIIIYAGSLVNPALLDLKKEGCVVYNSATMTLEQVIDVMKEAESKGQNVARLHTGDPCLYGAIREQIDALDALGIAHDDCILRCGKCFKSGIYAAGYLPECCHHQNGRKNTGSGAGEHCVFCGTSGNDGCILKHGTLRGTFP